MCKKLYIYNLSISMSLGLSIHLWNCGFHFLVNLFHCILRAIEKWEENAYLMKTVLLRLFPFYIS